MHYYVGEGVRRARDRGLGLTASGVAGQGSCRHRASPYFMVCVVINVESIPV